MAGYVCPCLYLYHDGNLICYILFKHVFVGLESAVSAVRKLEQERDALIREKSAWLNRFSEDNSRLAQMLKVTKEK